MIDGIKKRVQIVGSRIDKKIKEDVEPGHIGFMILVIVIVVYGFMNSEAAQLFALLLFPFALVYLATKTMTR